MQVDVDVELPDDFVSRQTGTDVPVSVAFKQCDTARLWVRLRPSTQHNTLARPMRC